MDGLFIPRKVKNVIFTFLTNQSLAMQAIDLRARPWRFDDFLR